MAEETITAQAPEIDPGMSVMPEGSGIMDVPTVIPELGLAAQALASQVSFAKKTWKDGSGGGTPVTAAELNRLEQGVADLTNAVNGLRDSVSRTARRVHTGTKVIDSVGSGETDVTLFTNEQFSSIVGRPFDQASDFVMAMSGEKDSIDRFPISVSYLKRDKSLIARISPGSVDMIRVNYLIITGV